MFYLEHILQGFVLTILMPTLFIATTMGFASLIESKWLSYTVTCVIAFLGSGLLFFGMLYYRLKKHFIFFQIRSLLGAVAINLSCICLVKFILGTLCLLLILSLS
jgi:phosphoglycerol transferase MdoB-like AlkP superfamily enzyme